MRAAATPTGIFKPRHADLRKRARELGPKLMHYAELMDAFEKAAQTAAT